VEVVVHLNFRSSSSFEVWGTAINFLTIVLLAAGLRASAQVNVTTYHNDIARTGLNPNETVLTPGNVNKATFGFRFSQPVDGYIVGQPLYLSNVAIPNAGVHNVVYVTTLNDSVYAFDADSNTGSNAAPLWQVNFTNSAAGVIPASGAFLPCPHVTSYPQAGIVSTPVIDPTTGTMYVVAKTNENGTVFHRIYALDVTTGTEKFIAPVAITGSSVANNQRVVPFNSLHAMNRPGLLLNNGTLYIAFGSNGCNDSSHGWVFSYDATSLIQTGIFNTSAEKGLASIWQTGSGPSADEDGNVYVSTAEGPFTADVGGQDFGSSVLKLVQGSGTLTLADYFTPFNQAFISQHDLDLSSSGTVVLPDQPGSNPHLLVATGKQGTVYLLDRDNMGGYNPNGDIQIVQELPSAVGAMFSTPVYWNNTVYFAGNANPIRAFTLSNGQLVTPPVAQSSKVGSGHPPTISANGTSNGLLWLMSGSASASVMSAYDALTLKALYATNQSGTRDAIPATAHFVTQTVANGNVYIGTETSLMVYGLLPVLAVTQGNNQSTTVTGTLPAPLQVQASDPYTGQGVAGITVTFSDGGKGGTFSNPSAITDATGSASTTYTFSKTARTVTITATNPGAAPTAFTETGTPGLPARLLIISGNKQTAQVNGNLPAPVVAKVSDAFNNGVAGVSVAFSDGLAGGSFSASPVVSDSLGRVSTIYTTSTKAGIMSITATAAGLSHLKFSEIATPGPAAFINVIAGNNQTGPPATVLPQSLVVQITDQFGNPVPNAAVDFDDVGAGGSFSQSLLSADANGEASSFYTTPPVTGLVNITVSSGSLSTNFTETAQ
jgi:hypothetical protein